MTRVDPGFRYPPELPPPTVPHRAFAVVVLLVAAGVVLGLLYAVAKSAGWLA